MISENKIQTTFFIRSKYSIELKTNVFENTFVRKLIYILLYLEKIIEWSYSVNGIATYKPALGLGQLRKGVYSQHSPVDYATQRTSFCLLVFLSQQLN